MRNDRRNNNNDPGDVNTCTTVQQVQRTQPSNKLLTTLECNPPRARVMRRNIARESAGYSIRPPEAVSHRLLNPQDAVLSSTLSS
jgi:hypothetical protein